MISDSNYAHCFQRGKQRLNMDQTVVLAVLGFQAQVP
jgi:hypothetical protein